MPRIKKHSYKKKKSLKVLQNEKGRPPPMRKVCCLAWGQAYFSGRGRIIQRSWIWS